MLQALISGYVSAAVTSEKADPERAMVVAGFSQKDVQRTPRSRSAQRLQSDRRAVVLGNSAIGVQIGPSEEWEDLPAWTYFPGQESHC